MPLCQMIRQLREQLGLSQDELAKRLGYKSRSTIAKIESGSNDIPQSKIAAFAAALETTPARLLGLDTPAEQAPRATAYTKRVPLLGTIAAGQPLFAEENIEEYIEINDSIRADFCLRVQGDSMINAGILSGDKVVVRPQNTADDGQIVVARIDEEATVKRLRRRNGEIWLLPENENYPPIDGTHAQIIGIVKAVVREY